MIKFLIKLILSHVLFVYSFFTNKKVNMEEVKTICVLNLKPLGIGDLIMDTPAINAIKNSYPDKKLVLITDKDFIKRNKEIDKIIIVKDWKEAIKIKTKFDLVILLNKNLLQSVVAFFLNKKYLIGYVHNWQGFSNMSHYWDMGGEVLKQISINDERKTNGILPKISGKLSRLNFTDEELSRVKKLVNYDENDKIVVFNTNVCWASRRWPLYKYKILAKQLPYKIVVVGGPEDINYNESFKNVINLTGKLSLFELSALCHICDIFVTGDSGPMHIAISENCKMLSLWGVTHPLTRLYKVNDDCRFIYPRKLSEPPIYKMEKETKNELIKSITIFEVRETIKEMLNDVVNNEI